MREIKFKAWHKGLKRFVVVTGLHYFEGMELSGISFDHEELGEQYDIPVEWFELCQFTGLLDAYKKEIYEGDILSGEQDNFIVSWRNNGYDLIGVSSDGFIHRIDNLAYFKFIGNIYQNPELIKES